MMFYLTKWMKFILNFQYLVRTILRLKQMVSNILPLT